MAPASTLSSGSDKPQKLDLAVEGVALTASRKSTENNIPVDDRQQSNSRLARLRRHQAKIRQCAEELGIELSSSQVGGSSSSASSSRAEAGGGASASVLAGSEKSSQTEGGAKDGREDQHDRGAAASEGQQEQGVMKIAGSSASSCAASSASSKTEADHHASKAKASLDLTALSDHLADVIGTLNDPSNNKKAYTAEDHNRNSLSLLSPSADHDLFGSKKDIIKHTKLHDDLQLQKQLSSTTSLLSTSTRDLDNDDEVHAILARWRSSNKPLLMASPDSGTVSGFGYNLSPDMVGTTSSGRDHAAKRVLGPLYATSSSSSAAALQKDKLQVDAILAAHRSSTDILDEDPDVVIERIKARLGIRGSPRSSCKDSVLVQPGTPSFRLPSNLQAVLDRSATHSLSSASPFSDLLKAGTTGATPTDTSRILPAGLVAVPKAQLEEVRASSVGLIGGDATTVLRAVAQELQGDTTIDAPGRAPHSANNETTRSQEQKRDDAAPEVDNYNKTSSTEIETQNSALHEKLLSLEFGHSEKRLALDSIDPIRSSSSTRAASKTTTVAGASEAELHQQPDIANTEDALSFSASSAASSSRCAAAGGAGAFSEIEDGRTRSSKEVDGAAGADDTALPDEGREVPAANRDAFLHLEGEFSSKNTITTTEEAPDTGASRDHVDFATGAAVVPEETTSEGDEKALAFQNNKDREAAAADVAVPTATTSGRTTAPVADPMIATSAQSPFHRRSMNQLSTGSSPGVERISAADIQACLRSFDLDPNTSSTSRTKNTRYNNVTTTIHNDSGFTSNPDVDRSSMLDHIDTSTGTASRCKIDEVFFPAGAQHLPKTQSVTRTTIGGDHSEDAAPACSGFGSGPADEPSPCSGRAAPEDGEPGALFPVLHQLPQHQAEDFYLRDSVLELSMDSWIDVGEKGSAKLSASPQDILDDYQQQQQQACSPEDVNIHNDVPQVVVGGALVPNEKQLAREDEQCALVEQQEHLPEAGEREERGDVDTTRSQSAASIAREILRPANKAPANYARTSKPRTTSCTTSSHFTNDQANNGPPPGVDFYDAKYQEYLKQNFNLSLTPSDESSSSEHDRVLLSRSNQGWPCIPSPDDDDSVLNGTSDITLDHSGHQGILSSCNNKSRMLASPSADGGGRVGGGGVAVVEDLEGQEQAAEGVVEDVLAAAHQKNDQEGEGYEREQQAHFREQVEAELDVAIGGSTIAGVVSTEQLTNKPGPADQLQGSGKEHEQKQNLLGQQEDTALDFRIDDVDEPALGPEERDDVEAGCPLFRDETNSGVSKKYEELPSPVHDVFVEHDERQVRRGDTGKIDVDAAGTTSSSSSSSYMIRKISEDLQDQKHRLLFEGVNNGDSYSRKTKGCPTTSKLDDYPPSGRGDIIHHHLEDPDDADMMRVANAIEGDHHDLHDESVKHTGAAGRKTSDMFDVVSASSSCTSSILGQQVNTLLFKTTKDSIDGGNKKSSTSTKNNSRRQEPTIISSSSSTSEVVDLRKVQIQRPSTTRVMKTKSTSRDAARRPETATTRSNKRLLSRSERVGALDIIGSLQRGVLYSREVVAPVEHQVDDATPSASVVTTKACFTSSCPIRSLHVEHQQELLRHQLSLAVGADPVSIPPAVVDQRQNYRDHVVPPAVVDQRQNYTDHVVGHGYVDQRQNYTDHVVGHGYVLTPADPTPSSGSINQSPLHGDAEKVIVAASSRSAGGAVAVELQEHEQGVKTLTTKLSSMPTEHAHQLSSNSVYKTYLIYKRQLADIRARAAAAATEDHQQQELFLHATTRSRSGAGGTRNWSTTTTRGAGANNITTQQISPTLQLYRPRYRS
ncbi:unnamed protein product [Amoebophrya sp. A120]|nr:unnamed protein product [Amoebophrya sp. A120]|eukprot:GSA120T00000728001.1